MGVADAVEALDATRISGRETVDMFEGTRLAPFTVVPALGLAGDSCAIAEFGRSGSLPAAFAFRCSAIISRNAFRLATPVVRDGPALAETD